MRRLMQAAGCLSVLALSACIDPQVGVRRTAGSAQTVRVAASTADEHRVQKGETLYAIAFRYALDFRDIARWNNIGDPYTIYPNQRLRLRDPTRMPTLEASAPRTAPPPLTSTTSTASSSTSSAPHGAISAPITPPVASNSASAIQAGQAVGPGDGVTVGALPPGGVVSETMSPSNSEGLPTGFIEGDPSNVASAAPVSSTPNASPTAPTGSSTAGSPATGGAVIAMSTPRVVPAAMPAESNPELELVAPSPMPTAKPVAGANGWGWPVQGKLIGTFASTDPARQGIDIAGNLGDSVHAAKAGEVVYSGRGIIGYGELIVIKHDDSTLTAYGHNRKRLVKEGQRVAQGERVAEMGKDSSGRALLHFELRRNGKPVDPLGVLPARR